MLSKILSVADFFVFIFFFSKKKALHRLIGERLCSTQGYFALAYLTTQPLCHLPAIINIAIS